MFCVKIEESTRGWKVMFPVWIENDRCCLNNDFQFGIILDTAGFKEEMVEKLWCWSCDMVCKWLHNCSRVSKSFIFAIIVIGCRLTIFVACYQRNRLWNAIELAILGYLFAVAVFFCHGRAVMSFSCPRKSRYGNVVVLSYIIAKYLAESDSEFHMPFWRQVDTLQF